MTRVEANTTSKSRPQKASNKTKSAAHIATGRPGKRNSAAEGVAIRRFLRAHIGEEWSDVFAALKATHTKVTGNFAQDTVAQGWGLAVKTSVKNGQLRVHVADKVCPLEGSTFEYYVHPESGLLLENGFLVVARRREKDREQARRTERESRMREVTPDLQVHKIAGKWFAVELASVNPDDRLSRFDVVLNRTVQYSERAALQALYGRKNVVGNRKRELQYRELREMQLVND